MGKIRINIHKKTPENKRKNCACICHLIPRGGGANTSTSAGSNDDLIMINRELQ